LGVTAVCDDLGLGSHDENLLFENAKIKVQNATLRNPDIVGMTISIFIIYQ
jgi:hypothetical protein